MKRDSGKTRWVAALLSVLISIAFGGQALAVTDNEVAAAMTGGQRYLFEAYGNGYWTGYSDLSATCFSVAALIETGKYRDPEYAARIDNAVKYIKTFVKQDGGIYQSNITYENGIALVALSLYGRETPQDAAYKTLVQNAISFFVKGQGADGGWTYGPDNTATYCDLSNTQFAVMGLWYGSKYLGLPIKGQTWATKLLTYLDNHQQASGGFIYAPGWSTTPQMTGAGLWCLAMIEEGQVLPGSRAEKAIGWFNANYGSQLFSNDYYAMYAVAKALTATLGKDNVGTHDWVADLKSVAFSTSSPITFPQTTPPTPNSWTNWIGPTIETPMVLMSLAFASTEVESTQKLLPEPPNSDSPPANQGLVTLHTTGGVTITTASRGYVGKDSAGSPLSIPPGVKLLIGSYDFVLNNVPAGGTTELTIDCPAGALDKNNPNGFLNPDGTIKTGLSWWKVEGGGWKHQQGVPIRLVPAGGPYNAIVVTLRDGGPEDRDGVVNGKIQDPGAPGVGAPVTEPAVAGGGDSGWCFIATAAYGSYMADDVVVLRNFRDRYLMTNPVGQAFVAAYYAASPPLADFIARHETLRAATRVALAPVVFGVKHPSSVLVVFGFAVLGIAVAARRRSNPL